jgi:hypothetical protein
VERVNVPAVARNRPIVTFSRGPSGASPMEIRIRARRFSSRSKRGQPGAGTLTRSTTGRNLRRYHCPTKKSPQTTPNEKTARRSMIHERFWVFASNGVACPTGPTTVQNLNLLARTNGAGQAAVVDTISRVPQWLTKFDSSTKYFDLLRTTRRRVRRLEMIVFVRNEVFIMTVTQNRFENVLTSAHLSFVFPVGSSSRSIRLPRCDSFQSNTRSQQRACNELFDTASVETLWEPKTRHGKIVIPASSVSSR